MEAMMMRDCVESVYKVVTSGMQNSMSMITIQALRQSLELDTCPRPARIFYQRVVRLRV